MEHLNILIIVLMATYTIVVIVFHIKAHSLKDKLNHKYGPIEELVNKQGTMEKEAEAKSARLKVKADDIEITIEKEDEKLKIIKEEIEAYKPLSELYQVAFYDVDFEYDTSEVYKEKIKSNKEKQKQRVKDKQALIVVNNPQGWRTTPQEKKSI